MSQVRQTTISYFKTFAGYGKVLEPHGPLEFRDTFDLDAYYRATYDAESSRLLRLEKVGVSRQSIDIETDEQPPAEGLYRVERTNGGIRAGARIDYESTEGLWEYLLVARDKGGEEGKGVLVTRIQVFLEDYAAGDAPAVHQPKAGSDNPNPERIHLHYSAELPNRPGLLSEIAAVCASARFNIEQFVGESLGHAMRIWFAGHFAEGTTMDEAQSLQERLRAMFPRLDEHGLVTTQQPLRTEEGRESIIVRVRSRQDPATTMGQLASRIDRFGAELLTSRISTSGIDEKLRHDLLLRADVTSISRARRSELLSEIQGLSKSAERKVTVSEETSR